jgi:L-alanine-DL-glutamate epimerase-like enolase superfamily enzyme
MQITKANVTPVELNLNQPVRMAGYPEINQVTAIFVHLQTRAGRDAWGCAVIHPDQTDQNIDEVLQACQKGADLAPDLNPIDIEYSLAYLTQATEDVPVALCAFDLAFHDLLGLTAGMPLHRILGGYRNKIMTSATVYLGTVQESVEQAQIRAQQGFRMLKIKGGLDPEEDVRRVQAIRRALPDLVLRLDADGGYTVEQALDVSRVLGNYLEMIEQPTPAEDLTGLRQVTRHSPVPVLADQSVQGPASALEFANHRYADGLSVKVAACGGLRCARQMDAIARVSHLTMMVSCMVEPALMISAGLSFALSSPGIEYADLDGYLDISNDPTIPGFQLEDGWLVATDVPGLGCTVEL